MSRIRWSLHLDALMVSVPICLQSGLHDTQKKYGFVLGPGGTSKTTMDDGIEPPDDV